MTRRIPIETLRSFTQSLLQRNGAREEDAEQVADVLVEADMRGIGSHGVARLPRYLKCMASGEIAVDAKPEVVSDRQCAIIVDAHHAFGQVAGIFGMEKAFQAAEAFGIGMACVRASNHFGIAGYYAQRATSRGMIGLAMTNTAPLVVPTGGMRAILGTNPIAVAVPYRGGEWLMDFSTSAVSRGKIEVYEREQRPLEDGWAVDERGLACTSASHVLSLLAQRLAGGIAPMADYKGYGLAALVDILSGVLSGSAFGKEVGATQRGDVGHVFMAIDVSRFMSPMQFEERMELFCESLRQSASPGNRVFLHGEKEQIAREESLAQGVAIPSETDAILRKIAAEWDGIRNS